MNLVLKPSAGARPASETVSEAEGEAPPPQGARSEPEAMPLAAASPGEHVRIAEVLGGKHLLRRLADLGLRVGSRLEVVNRRGCGVMVRTRGQVVALGGGVARKVLVTRPQS